MHAKFEGYLEASRPLADLTTVFDMCGWPIESRPTDTLAYSDRGVAIEVTAGPAWSGHRYTVTGIINAKVNDPVVVLTRLALALEADGVAFQFSLSDAHGAHMHTFEPVGQ